MTEAEISTQPSRRKFLGHAVGAIAATAILSAATQRSAENHPDAVLLATCATFAYACAELARIDATPGLTDEDAAPFVEMSNAPIDTIVSLPATTPDGIRAKAQAVIDAFKSGGVQRLDDETVEEAANWHELMAWRLAQDILACGGRIAA